MLSLHTTGPTGTPRTLFPVLAAFVLLNCAKPDPNRLTQTQDIPQESGKPKIISIQDFSSYTLPSEGKISPPKGDGRFVPGELFLIRGKNFGRLPTVTVSGKATPVLARLGDGAIFARVPHGLSGGKKPIAVSTERGIAQQEVALVRFALAHAPGAPETLLYNAWSWKLVKTYKFGRVMGAAFAKGAPYLYVLTRVKGRVLLLTLDLTHQPAPQLVDKKPVEGSTLLGFGYSERAAVLVAITDRGVQGFDLTSARFPLANPLQPWPKTLNIKNVVQGALSPDGKTVALLLHKENSVALFDVQVLHNMKSGPRLALLPDAKVPLLKGLGFKAQKNGQTLFVLTGDTPASLKVGYHDNKMVVVDLKSAKDRTKESTLKLEETRPLNIDKVTPSQVRFSTKGASKEEDTGVNRWTTFFYLNTFHAELLTLAKLPLSTPSGIQRGIELIDTLPYLSVLHRVDQKSTPKTFRKAKSVMGTFTITPDGKQALVVSCTPKTDKAGMAVQIPCGVEILDLATGRAKVKALGRLTKETFQPPFRFGVTAVQE